MEDQCDQEYDAGEGLTKLLTNVVTFSKTILVKYNCHLLKTIWHLLNVRFKLDVYSPSTCFSSLAIISIPIFY